VGFTIVIFFGEASLLCRRLADILKTSFMPTKRHTIIEVKKTGKIITERLADKHIVESGGIIRIEKLRKKKGGWRVKKSFPKADVVVLL